MNLKIKLSPSEILQARYIYEEAIKLGWIEEKSYWFYPLVSPDGQIIGKRGKAYPNQKIPKYIWPDGKPEDLDTQWYIAPDTKDEIEKAGGLAYLANGSPAMIAYRVAGIRNVLATELSEIAVPKNIINYCNRMGITSIIYPVDKDEAGMQSAINWRDALAGSGIDFIALQWPDTMPAKADANDVLIYCKGNAEEFNWILRECTEEIELPISTVQKPIQFDYSSDKTPQGLIDTIASALGIHDWNNDGWSRKNVHCIFHDDSHESAGFNHISGVFHCFALCGSHSPKVVADRLGIDWKQYYPPKREKKAKLSKKSKQKSDIDQTPEIEIVDPRRIRHEPIIMEIPQPEIIWSWINQDDIPHSWVKAMLTLCHSKSATTVYAIRFHRAVRKALINPQLFTINEIQAILGAYDDYGVWRKAPRKSVQNFVDTMLAWNFFRILLPIESLEDIETKSGKNSDKKVGRPKIEYSICTDTDMLKFRLAELLEPALMEILVDKELAPRNHTFRDSIGLPVSEYRIWKERINTARHEIIMKQIEERIKDVIENNFSMDYTDEDLAHPSCLRGKLIRMLLAPYSRDINDIEAKQNGIKVSPKGIQLSKGKIALELGCSESSLKSLYTENNVGAMRIKGWVEVINPNNCDILAELREAPLKLSKELGGFTIGIKLKVYKPLEGKSEYLKPVYSDKAVEHYEKWNGRIEKLYIWVEQPSLLWLMNKDEIAAKRLEIAKKEADSDEIEDVENEVSWNMPKSIEGEEKAEKKPRKKSFMTGKDRTDTQLNPDYIAEQMALEVHQFTPYKLSGLSILDDSDKLITELSGYKELVIWLNQNASKKAIRSVFSFYGGIEIEMKKKSAIYYIHCEPLNKTYVGASEDVQESVKNNLSLLAKKKHSCVALQAAYNEFGKDSLQWGVLEDCESSELAELEKQWIAKISKEKEWAVFNRV